MKVSLLIRQDLIVVHKKDKLVSKSNVSSKVLENKEGKI